MRTFSVPASYRRYVEGAIAMALADVGKDVERREDDDERIRAMAPVPDHMIDSHTGGRLLIVVGVSEEAP